MATLFEHAQGYRDVHRALVRERGAVIVTSWMRALFAELVQDDLSKFLPPASPDAIPRSALVAFVVDSLMSVLAWWLDRGCDRSPMEVVSIFRRLAMPAIVGSAGRIGPWRLSLRLTRRCAGLPFSSP